MKTKIVIKKVCDPRTHKTWYRAYEHLEGFSGNGFELCIATSMSLAEVEKRARERIKEERNPPKEKVIKTIKV